MPVSCAICGSPHANAQANDALPSNYSARAMSPCHLQGPASHVATMLLGHHAPAWLFLTLHTARLTEPSWALVMIHMAYQPPL